MDITPLEIELVRQKPRSSDSLRACAYMIFNYYGSSITKEELWKKLHVYKKHSGLTGSYMQDLGKIAHKLGYKTEIYHYDWSRWNESIQTALIKSKKSTIKVLKALKSEKKDWPDKKIVQKDINYLKSKGSIQFSIPQLINIDKYLMDKTPVILSVKANYFYHQPSVNYKHCVLIIGKKEGKYKIRDPLYAINKIDENELLYSWCQASGWMTVIHPKEEPPQIKQSRLKF